MGGWSLDLLNDEGLTLPANARTALAVLVNQPKKLDQQIDAIKHELAHIQRANPVAKLPSSLPGIGPITAKALAATVPDPTLFARGESWWPLFERRRPMSSLSPCQTS